MSSELPTVLRGWQITQAKKKAAGNSRGPKSQSEIVLLFDPLRKTVQRKLDTICQNPPERVTRSVQTKPVRALDAFPDLRRGGRRRPHTIAGSASAIFKKGGDPAAGSPTATLLRLHPNHRPYLRRLPPCGWRSDFWYRRLSWCDGRCVQGPGTYSAQPADLRLLAIPTSCRRVAACNPN